MLPAELTSRLIATRSFCIVALVGMLLGACAGPASNRVYEYPTKERTNNDDLSKNGEANPSDRCEAPPCLSEDDLVFSESRERSSAKHASKDHQKLEEQGFVELESVTALEFPDHKPATHSTQVFTVAVISDMNEGYGSTYHRPAVHSAVDWLVNDVFPDLVLSTGDMVAGQQAGLDYRAMWRAFHRAVTEPLWQAKIPFAVTPGNHDASMYGPFRQERAIFVDEWNHYKPNLTWVDDSNYPIYYAFTLGPALFISLDATSIGPITEEQRRWVAQTLSANRHLPVKMVYGHVPLYPFAQGREREILNDVELEQILLDHDVDLMITGHHHAYYPGRKGKIRLVSTACLGAGARFLIGETERSERSVILIHFNEQGILSLEAHRSSDWTSTIERHTLPESLNYREHRIVRDDLVPDHHHLAEDHHH